MTLEETTELYASVLRQLLPVGGYDTSPNTEVLSKDIYAHAKLFAHADLDAKRLLNVLEGFPSELISEYEAEYGLPLKCSINAGRTLAERTEILRWIRQHRNVMNRGYLEQILAIFDVTLVDVVKHRPMLCTAPCTSPVNTERLRYKVLLRLQYPMTANMSCIIENYLPGYLRIEWVVDMPWSDWTLNPGMTINTNGIAHYTAYKTNQREFYDSYANLDLTAAIVRSLHDTDMQQWQAVKDALKYFEQATSSTAKTGYEHYGSTTCFSDRQTTCDSFRDKYFPSEDKWAASYSSYEGKYVCYRPNTNQTSYTILSSCVPSLVYTYTFNENSVLFSSSEKTYSVNHTDVAQKILSNASSSDQAISLLAEAYIEAVANSIFNADESKQFVKLSDLLSQFELNKTLRT